MRRSSLIIAVCISCLAATAAAVFMLRPQQSDKLWQIVHDECSVNQAQSGNPSPCQRIDAGKSYALLKDRNGLLQYLLIPTQKISGIESPALLEAGTPNYFADAWAARGILAEKLGHPIDDKFLSLTINSAHARSQRQLHIHMSCLAPEVREQLDAHASAFTDRWSEVPGGLQGHTYLARRITAGQLTETSPFQRLASEVPNARQAMDHYGLGLVSLADGQLLLLATACTVCAASLSSAEEIQDHACRILPKT